ncbi:MAG: GNAT family N-acetyltransferase [Pseudomonadota bacterium]
MIRTERLTLRPWAARDLHALDPILGDAEVMRFSDHGVLGSKAQEDWLKEKINHATDRSGLGCHAIEERISGAVVGYISMTSNPNRVAGHEAEIGFRLRRSAWGQGYATEAAEAVIEAARTSKAIQRVVAIVDPNNAASVRVLRKLGMQFEREIMFEGYDYPDGVYVLSVG